MKITTNVSETTRTVTSEKSLPKNRRERGTLHIIRWSDYGGIIPASIFLKTLKTETKIRNQKKLSYEME